jgi:hypothetical protein
MTSKAHSFVESRFDDLLEVIDAIGPEHISSLDRARIRNVVEAVDLLSKEMRKKYDKRLRGEEVDSQTSLTDEMRENFNELYIEATSSQAREKRTVPYQIIRFLLQQFMSNPGQCFTFEQIASGLGIAASTVSSSKLSVESRLSASFILICKRGQGWCIERRQRWGS